MKNPHFRWHAPEEEPPIQKLVRALFDFAIRKEATEIRLTYKKDLLLIEMEIKGVWCRMISPPQNMSKGIVNMLIFGAGLEYETKGTMEGLFYLESSQSHWRLICENQNDQIILRTNPKENED